MKGFQLNTAALVSFGYCVAAAWGYVEQVSSRREYFYVGGEYANLKVSSGHETNRIYC